MEDKGEPKIDDFMDIMQDLQKGPIQGLRWKFIVWCDENGNSEFMDNFYKEMVRAAENFDYEKLKNGTNNKNKNEQ